MKMGKVWIALFLAAWLMIPAAAVFAEEPATSLRNIYLSMENLPENDYEKYIELHRKDIYIGEQVSFPAPSAEGRPEIKEGESQTIVLNVKETALYVISFDYMATGTNILTSEMSLKVNGKQPYAELSRIRIGDIWESGAKTYDRFGNESIAMPHKIQKWSRGYLNDTSCLYSEPMLLYLEKGANTIEIAMEEGSIILGGIYLSGKEGIPADSETQATGKEYVLLEAEGFNRSNNPNIHAGAEFNTAVTPYDPDLRVQNIIKEDSFKTGGASVEYDVEIQSDGWYNLALDYRQGTKAGMPVFRNIRIDGKYPSLAYQNVKFDYSMKFKRRIVDAPVYLKAGKHILNIQVALDSVRDAIHVLTKINREISDFALDISKITGGNTDKYRDFNLDIYGLDVKGELLKWAQEIDQVHKSMSGEFKNNNIGDIELLKAAAKNLRRLAKKPNDLPKYLNEFSYSENSARQSIVSVIEAISKSELSLDKLLLYQKDASIPGKMGFFESILNGLKHFAASFTQKDYSPDYKKNDTLQVWISRPRQYLEIIQRMADADFTKKTGINVDFSIVPDQSKLILANASGKTPDAVIGIGSGFVYDLALRGALKDMRGFDTFKEVARRVPTGLLIPGACDQGMYAIPETFNFWVLFYRKDILDSLGLKVPNSMDEVRSMLPELKRRGLDFNNHIANMPARPYSATMPYLFQAGGKLFKDGGTTCEIDTEENIQGLNYLVENFTIYNMDYEVLSFYQNFRDGRMPVGISEYGTFNLLVNAAPEIADIWDIAPYPGLVGANGEVSRYTCGAAESDVIFAASKKTEEAWDFIDWWMSGETQSKFAFMLQSTLGNEYMWNSANQEALLNSPWSSRHKQVIADQLKWTMEPPCVPGGYMIDRELGNIVNSVVTTNKNIRSAIDEADKRINREIRRKLEEFGYLEDGKMKKPLVIADIKMMEEWLK